VDITEPKENPAQQLNEVVAEPVVRIQNVLVDLQAFNFQTANNFADNALDR
jgi:hypothetical protein